MTAAAIIATSTTRITRPEGALVVSYGAGVDSTAMLIEMHNQGLVPDMITFGDTGAEKPETYDYLEIMNTWCQSVGFPEITICRKLPLPETCAEKYTDFEGNCLYGETLPFLTFGKASCSPKWKQVPQDYAIKGCTSWHNIMEPSQIWKDHKAGAPRITKFIGYDDSKADRKRAAKSDKINAKLVTKGKRKGERESSFEMAYPLQQMGLVREDCIRIIQAAGMPVPIKSACYFCPSSQKWELFWLAAVHPHMFMQALKIERTALLGKHSRFHEEPDWASWEDMIRDAESYPNLKTCAGLGIKFSWNHFARIEGITDVNGHFVADRDWCLVMAEHLKGNGGNASDQRTC